MECLEPTPIGVVMLGPMLLGEVKRMDQDGDSECVEPTLKGLASLDPTLLGKLEKLSQEDGPTINSMMGWK